jgi:2-hydroxymethylglutarate dehydrogenase
MHNLKNKKIGFIGLGNMGQPMASNLLKARFPVIAYDVRKEPVLELEKLGVKVAENAREVGAESDTVIVMVLGYEQIKEVIFSPDGALNAMKSGTTLIIMSTISPLEASEAGKQAKERGIDILDAPVSGGVIGAEAGTLAIMVGGDAKVFRNNEDILKAMGKNIHHVGELGMGEAVKMINQILVMAGIVATTEAMIMAEKLGMNLEALFEIITQSAGDSLVFREWASTIISRDFTPSEKIDIWVKDSGIVMRTAMDLGIPLPAASVAQQLFKIAQNRGLGQLHSASLIKLYEEFGQVLGYD